MRKINAVVDLDLGSFGKAERSRAEIAKAINRKTGRFVESGEEIRRCNVRKMMVNMMHPGLERDLVMFFKRFLDRRHRAAFFDFFQQNFWVRLMRHREFEASQTV